MLKGQNSRIFPQIRQLFPMFSTIVFFTEMIGTQHDLMMIFFFDVVRLWFSSYFSGLGFYMLKGQNSRIFPHIRQLFPMFSTIVFLLK